ncbi:hypothetical protein OQA88_6461 [Cercophora sp. LCS_1]
MSKGASNNNPLPGGRTREEEEEELRQQAIRQAMIDDIGLGRLEELPLDDKKKEDDHRHNYRGGRITNHRAGQSSGRAPRPGPTAANLWQAAINSGVFDDDDAEAVKGLDDLGGGRLYGRVRDQSLQILNQMQPPNRRLIHHPANHPRSTGQPNRYQAYNQQTPQSQGTHQSAQLLAQKQVGKAPVQNTPVRKASQQQPARVQGPHIPAARQQFKPGQITPSNQRTQPSRPPALVQQKPARPPQNLAQGYSAITTSTKALFSAEKPGHEPPNTVLMMKVGFYSQGDKTAEGAIIYLTVGAPGPAQLIVFRGGIEVFRESMAQFSNVMTGQDDDHLLAWIEFRRPNGLVVLHALYFENREHQFRFVSSLRKIQGQRIAVQSPGQELQTSTPASAPFKAPEPPKAPTQVDPSSPVATRPRPTVRLPSNSPAVRPVSTHVEPAPSVTVVAESVTSDLTLINAPSESDTLVNLEDDEVSQVGLQQSATELLATLEPYNWDAEYYHHLERVFTFAEGAVGSAVMDSAAMKEAIKAAIIIHRLQIDENISRENAVRLADKFFTNLEGRAHQPVRTPAQPTDISNQSVGAARDAQRLPDQPVRTSAQPTGTLGQPVSPGRETERVADQPQHDVKETGSRKRRHYSREQLFDCREHSVEPFPPLTEKEFLPLPRWARPGLPPKPPAPARPTPASGSKSLAQSGGSMAWALEDQRQELSPAAGGQHAPAAVSDIPEAASKTTSDVARPTATTKPQGPLISVAENVDTLNMEDLDISGTSNPNETQSPAEPAMSVNGTQIFGTMMNGLNQAIGLAGSRWAPRNLRSRTSYLDELAGLSFTPRDSQTATTRASRRRLVEEALAQQASQNVATDSGRADAASPFQNLQGYTAGSAPAPSRPPSSHAGSVAGSSYPASNQTSSPQQRQPSQPPRRGGLVNSRHAY